MRTSKLALGLLSLSFLLSNCNSGSSNSYDSAVTYQEAKMSLEDQEKQSPTQFLTTDGTYRSNLIGEWVLEGTVTNTATVAKYKDVVLIVEFLSKTGTLLGTENHAIYEFFPAGKTKRFKIKTAGYQGTSKVNWSIESATAAD